LQAEVIDFEMRLVLRVISSADSLARATEYTLAAKRPELLRRRTLAPTANPSASAKNNTATVNKKLQAAESQPPAMKGEEQNGEKS
jgi:hypothetical protein